MLRAFFFWSNAITVHVCGWALAELLGRLTANAEVKTIVGDPWHFGADRIPGFIPPPWIMDPYSTPFFSDFKDAKKEVFFFF